METHITAGRLHHAVVRNLPQVEESGNNERYHLQKINHYIVVNFSDYTRTNSTYLLKDLPTQQRITWRSFSLMHFIGFIIILIATVFIMMYVSRRAKT